MPSRRSRRLSTPAALLVGCALILACDRDRTGPEVSLIRFLAGDGLVDTALATPATALVVQILDEQGRFAVGAIARFEALPKELSVAPTMTVLPPRPRPQGNNPHSIAFDTADVRGRVSVQFQMGRVAGPGSIGIYVHGLALADTATFTIQPGAAVAMRAQPSDTALYAGASYELRAFLVDQHANVRSDEVTLAATSLDPAIAVQGPSRVVAQELGRARAVVTADAFTDTAYVSVVPVGTLALYRPRLSDSDTAGTLLIETDLSDARYREFTVGEPVGSRTMDWSPDGQRIVLSQAGLGGDRLFRVEPDGQLERLIETDYGVVHETWPQYSPDGEWIFYGAIRPDAREIWRVRADGSGPERVGPPAQGFDEDAHPSVSPDGRRVVYQSDRDFSWELHILDLETGGVDSLGVAGEAPRWSPVDDRIAFLANDGLRVINADGTGNRVVTSGGNPYGPPMDWSPDGAWLVVRRKDSGVELIHVATGMILPLAWTLNLHSPAWRP